MQSIRERRRWRFVAPVLIRRKLIALRDWQGKFLSRMLDISVSSEMERKTGRALRRILAPPRAVDHAESAKPSIDEPSSFA